MAMFVLGGHPLPHVPSLLRCWLPGDTRVSSPQEAPTMPVDIERTRTFRIRTGSKLGQKIEGLQVAADAGAPLDAEVSDDGDGPTMIHWKEPS